MRAAVKAGLTLALLTPLLQAQAARPPCEGRVSFGEGRERVVARVQNREIDGACLNDLLVDTEAEGANYGSHAEFVLAVSKQSARWVERRELRPREATALLRAALRSEVGKTLRVRLIAFNDFHGNIDGSNLTLRSDPDNLFVTLPNGTRAGAPAGGVDYMAGLVKQLKQGSPNNVVVSAGDLIGASPVNSALFHDEPTIEAMNRLGLGFNAVGNHEFDEGQAELLRMQRGGCHPTDANSCRGADVGTPVPFEGAKFEFLAANVVRQDGRTLFPAYGVRSLEGHEVAFIGMTLEGTPTIVSPGGVAGLQFRDEADTVNALVQPLRQRGVDAVVVLVHEGGVPTAGSLNGCNGISGPIVDIVGRLDDAVDLVVSGHTHQAYNCRIRNGAGREIPVTSAGSFSRVITTIDLKLDTRRKAVVSVTASNQVVDRSNVLGSATPIQPVAELTELVAAYNRIVAPIANRPIGSITADITRARTAAGESAMGDAVADAQLAATAAADKGGSKVAFMNTGGLRADLSYAGSTAGEGDGNVTYGEAFTVQPFGNSLVVKTLTGQQIYDLLEQQWGTGQFADGGRTLQVSEGFGYRHTFVPNASPLGGRYVCDGSVTLGGVPVDKAAPYRVTMNSFLATGGDNFMAFNLGTEVLGGEVDLDAFETYLKARSPVPPGARNRIVQVAACP